MESESKKKTKKICAVAVCPSPKDSHIIYHSFPKNDLMKKTWVVKCKRDDSFNCRFATVCSNHFLPSDYERDLRNELLGIPQRKKLKQDAVPSQNLHPLQKIEQASILTDSTPHSQKV